MSHTGEIIDAMTGESPPLDTGAAVGGRRRDRRLSRGVIAGILLTVVAAGLAGFWWQSRRPDARYARAQSALAAGDSRSALREARWLMETPGYEAHGRLLTGLVQARNGEFKKALYQLQFAARDPATEVEALTVAAECYYRLGQLLDATKTARTALARDDGALDARRWLASAYYDLGAMADAIAHLERLSADAPDDASPQYLLGVIAKDNERFADAIRHYRESLRRDPQQPHRESAQLELSESLIKLSRFDEALDVLRDCGRTARTLTLTAECHQNLGRADEAQRLLDSARELDPSYGPAFLQQGALFLLLGQTDGAQRALEEAARLAPHNGQVHFHLSQVYARKGDDAKSAEHLRLMQEIRSAEREFSELHDVASEKPADADIRVRIGTLARKLGKPDLARSWFRAAMALQPDHAAARSALAELETSPAPP